MIIELVSTVLNTVVYTIFEEPINLCSLLYSFLNEQGNEVPMAVSRLDKFHGFVLDEHSFQPGLATAHILSGFAVFGVRITMSTLYTC